MFKTNDAETQVTQEWLGYVQDSINSLHSFKGELLHMAENGNRELNPGGFIAAMRKLNDVIGSGYLDDAAQDLDKLAAVVTGEGLPQVVVCANDQTRKAAQLGVIFGQGSTLILEVRFMPVERVDWSELTPHLVKVRKEYLHLDVLDFFANSGARAGMVEARYNKVGGSQGYFTDLDDGAL